MPDDRRGGEEKGRGVKRVGGRGSKTCGRGLADAVKPTNNSLLLAFDDWFIWENTHIIWSLTISVRDMIAQWSLTLLQGGLDIKRGERGDCQGSGRVTICQNFTKFCKTES